MQPRESFASTPLILTKLQPPLVRANTVARERLAASVRATIQRRVTLLCAGPGYGKTTLIASTLRELRAPLLWYALSRSDNDIITFYTYLIAACERQWRGFERALRPVFAPRANPQALTETFIAALVNQLAKRATADFIFVLDDFQLVEHTPALCETLDLLIQHAPPQAHFCIATRAAPAFRCLPRLRAEGQALEIDESALKFTDAEAAALFQEFLELELAEPARAALVEQIEGWALGLMMAGQTLKARRAKAIVSATLEHADAPNALSLRTVLPYDDKRVLFEYLSEEVLRQQPPATADFLTSSAILSRLEPALCDAALGRSDSAEQLRRLEKHCVFILRTPDGWMRYHRLFREFLLHQLARAPERRETLHRRAAHYFQTQGDFETAIFHWNEAGARRDAARLIVALADDLFDARRFETLTFWFEQLSADEFAEFPILWLYWGKICEAQHEAETALDYYERAAEGCNALGDLLGLSAALNHKAHILDWRNGDHVEAERLQRQALSYVGAEHHRQRAALLANLARNQLSAGNTAAAQTLYREALALYENDRQGELTTLLNPGSWLYHSMGDYLQAVAALHRAEQLANELNDARRVEVYNNLAVNLYYLGRYQQAGEYADKALALARAQGDAHQEAFALMNQANALEMTCGASYADLHQQYMNALRIEQRLDNRRFIIATLVFMTILTRHNGEMAEAVTRGQYARNLANERGLRWLCCFVSVQLGAAQIWLDADAARATLDEALQLARECGDVYQTMASHFWLASLYYSTDDARHLEQLRECLRLAVAQNYDYFFRSEMQAAIPLLVAAIEHDIWSAYVTPLLAKMGARAVDSLEPLLDHARAEVRQRAQRALAQMGVTRAARPPRSRALTSPALTLRAFGNFTVWRGDECIQERAWGRRKCKRLLKYLALAPHHTLSKDAAVELLSADAEPHAANANFYRTLYNLRRVLEPLAPESGSNYLALQGGLVSLVMENVAAIDVDEFTRRIEAGRAQMRQRNFNQARQEFSSAIELYVDDVATDDLFDDWVQPHREKFLNLYRAALNELGELAARACEWERAAEYFARAFKKDYGDEIVCLKLIDCLTQLGRRVDALQAFDACARALRELGLEPSSELRAALGLKLIPA